MFTTELLVRQAFAEVKWFVFGVGLGLVGLGILIGWLVF
jgi:hypothetical protein